MLKVGAEGFTIDEISGEDCLATDREHGGSYSSRRITCVGLTPDLFSSPLDSALQPFLYRRRHHKKVIDDLPDGLAVERSDFQFALFRIR